MYDEKQHFEKYNDEKQEFKEFIKKLKLDKDKDEENRPKKSVVVNGRCRWTR